MTDSSLPGAVRIFGRLNQVIFAKSNNDFGITLCMHFGKPCARGLHHSLLQRSCVIDVSITFLQWRRKLENFEGDGDEKLRVKGGHPLENSSVLQSICFLPRENFATF